jgi:hypothetical protein
MCKFEVWNFLFMKNRSYPMQVRSRISYEAGLKIGDYSVTFPEAYQFLGSIGKDQVEGFWMGTAQNAHLYYMDAYFAYIKFYPHELEFAQKLNMRIYDGTEDRAKYLFREPLKELARKHDLINSRIVTFQGGEKIFDKMFTRRGTPTAFFDDLLQLIRDIYNQKPW